MVANVSNTVGLVPGGISGVIGYRRELRGLWRRTMFLAIGTTAGALLGGILLLSLPDAVFDAVVPVLILLAAVLMAIKRTPASHADVEHTRPRRRRRRSPPASTAATSAPRRGSS